jgi:uncharacterized membrane protein
VNYDPVFVFDPATEAAIRQVWQSIADAGLPSFMLGLDYPPHMTAFTAEVTDEVGMRAALADLAAHTSPLEVSFLSVAHFLEGGEVAFLAPVINHALLNLHEAVWEVTAAYTRARPSYYAPGVWVPHVTVAFRTPPEQVGLVAALLAQVKPLKGKITGILFGVLNLEGGSKYESIEFCG